MLAHDFAPVNCRRATHAPPSSRLFPLRDPLVLPPADQACLPRTDAGLHAYREETRLTAGTPTFAPKSAAERVKASTLLFSHYVSHSLSPRIKDTGGEHSHPSTHRVNHPSTSAFKLQASRSTCPPPTRSSPSSLLPSSLPPRRRRCPRRPPSPHPSSPPS